MYTLNSENVEFLDFDLKTSLQFNAHLYKYLPRKKLHRMAASFGFKSNEFLMAREWISRDFMIIESAISANSDIILSCDEKTFVPICKELKAPCAVTDPTRFEHSEKFILQYLG